MVMRDRWNLFIPSKMIDKNNKNLYNHLNKFLNVCRGSSLIGLPTGSQKHTKLHTKYKQHKKLAKCLSYLKKLIFSTTKSKQYLWYWFYLQINIHHLYLLPYRICKILDFFWGYVMAKCRHNRFFRK